MVADWCAMRRIGMHRILSGVIGTHDKCWLRAQLPSHVCTVKGAPNVGVTPRVI